MGMHKIVLATLLVTLCILGLSLPVSAQPTGAIGLEPGIINIAVSTNFDVKVSILSLSGPMSQFSLEVFFDPTLVEHITHVNFVETRGWTILDEAVGDFGNGMEYRIAASGPAYSADAVWAIITFHCLAEGDSVITAMGTVRSVIGGAKSFFDPVQISVHQVTPAPVGGIVAPTNKLSIIAPYLALAGLVAAVSTVIVVRRRKP